MNFAGAMRGLGEGMQSFSGTLKEKQNMDWTAQQNQLKHERDMNLQRLRETNANKRADAQIGSSEKMGMLKIQSADTRAQAGIDATIANTNQQHENRLDQIGAQADANTQQREAAYNFAETKSTEKREAEVAALTESPQFKQLPPKDQEVVLFAAQHPEAAKTLQGLNKLDKFPTEQYNKAYAKGNDQWDAIDKNEKAPILQRAASLGIKDPADIRDLYATEYARQATGLDKLIEADAKGGPPEAKALSPAAKQRAKDNPTQITPEVIAEATNPEDQAYLQDIYDSQEMNRAGGALQAIPVSSKRVSDEPTGNIGTGMSIRNPFTWLKKLADESNAKLRATQ